LINAEKNSSGRYCMNILDSEVSRKDKNQGFTLVELLVALVIFSIGIVGAAKLHTTAIAGNTYSMQLTHAMNIAHSEAERLQDVRFTTTQVTDGTTAGDLSDNLEVTSESRPLNTGTVYQVQDTVYTPTYTVTPVNGDARLLHVNMNVAWNDKGSIRNYNMRFYTGIN